MDDRLRAIADYLLGCRNAREVDPVAVGSPLLPFMFVLAIERRSPPDHIRLRIRLVGTAIDSAFQRQLRGRCLEEFMHGPSSDDVIRTFHRCADTQRPAWMRQVVSFKEQSPRFVEGVAVYLTPDRIYGGLVMGEQPPDPRKLGFESAPLR